MPQRLSALIMLWLVSNTQHDQRRDQEVGSPFAIALELGFGVPAKLRACGGEVGKDLVGAQDSAVTGGGDDGLAFVGVHEARGFEEVWLLIGSDDDEPVLVGVNEITECDLATKDLDLAVPTHGMHMRVTDAQPTSESLEARIGHLIHIADGSIHDGAHAAKGVVRLVAWLG
jgi:hypothetical protein